MQAEKLPASIFGRLDRLIDRLEKWPEVSGAKPLSGNLAGHFRLRTGDYRVQFRVEGETDRCRAEASGSGRVGGLN